MPARLPPRAGTAAPSTSGSAAMDVDPPAAGGGAEEEGEGGKEEGEDEDGEEVEALGSGELFVARCRANRSAATLYLTWVWLELRGRLRTCPLTGMDGPHLHQSPSSRPPHRLPRRPRHTQSAHQLRLVVSLPSSIGDFDEGSINVAVQSWFANKWLGSWRGPSLKATPLRRVDWLLVRGAEELGLGAMTAEETAAVQAFCGGGQGAVSFPFYAAAERNQLRLARLALQ